MGAPQFEGVRSSAQIEFDFYGLEPTDARVADSVIFGTPRIRHAFLKLETKAVDVVAGQYYDLFGWGSYFYPATVAYLGVPGMVYHRAPQLRLEKKIRAGDVEVMLAVAAVRAGERDSGVSQTTKAGERSRTMAGPARRRPASAAPGRSPALDPVSPAIICVAFPDRRLSESEAGSRFGIGQRLRHPR